MPDEAKFSVEATEWKVEKFDGPKPKDTKLRRFMLRWLPIRGKLPFEIITGGDAKETEWHYPKSEPYMDWLRKRYPRTIGRIKKRGTG